jgi:hypothetical protein
MGRKRFTVVIAKPQAVLPFFILHLSSLIPCMFNYVIILYVSSVLKGSFPAPEGAGKKSAEISFFPWFPKPWMSLRLVSGPIGQPEQSLGINLF